jgi:hypothetical protein
MKQRQMAVPIIVTALTLAGTDFATQQALWDL